MVKILVAGVRFLELDEPMFCVRLLLLPTDELHERKIVKAIRGTFLSHFSQMQVIAPRA